MLITIEFMIKSQRFSTIIAFKNMTECFCVCSITSDSVIKVFNLFSSMRMGRVRYWWHKNLKIPFIIHWIKCDFSVDNTTLWRTNWTVPKTNCIKYYKNNKWRVSSMVGKTENNSLMLLTTNEKEALQNNPRENIKFYLDWSGLANEFAK